MIIPEYNSLFVHVNRTGGTSIEKLFGEPVWDHRTLKEYINLGPAIRSLYKFSVVRNPWDKEVSDYFHHKKIKNLEMSFEEYFKQDEFISTNKRFKFHSNQFDWLTDETDCIKVHYIIKFEKFEEHLKSLAIILGVKFEEIPKLNFTSHNHYREYYTEKLKSFVHNLYEKDIRYFGYKF